MPHDLGLPVQDGSSVALLPPVEEAKTENFLESLVEPHRGHLVPFQLGERTKTSLSRSHCSQ
jgi:hypothetical protein